MILGEIIFRATGQDVQTFADYFFSKINIDALWWKDFVSGQSNGNLLAYCCLDSMQNLVTFIRGIWEDGTLNNSYVDKIRELEYYGLQFWKVCAKSPDVNGNCPDNIFIHSTIGFDGQYIMIDFNRNIVVNV